MLIFPASGYLFEISERLSFAFFSITPPIGRKESNLRAFHYHCVGSDKMLYSISAREQTRKAIRPAPYIFPYDVFLFNK